MEGAQGTHKASKLASEDVISSMPENVITNIMNRLPIRDAVRTSILASNWRLNWTLLTQLVFDTEVSQYLVTLGPDGKRYYDSRIISRLLLALKGSVTKFVLYLDHDHILDIADLNHWLLFLSRKGIKEFTFVNSHRQSLKMPIHLFSCLELTHLKLVNCLLHPSPPNFGGFPNLLSLDFRGVRFESGKFITRCSLLEIMEIVGDSRCYLISKINMDDITKLENLKKLTLSMHELENTAITTSGIFKFLGFLPKLEELDLNFQRFEGADEFDVIRTARFLSNLGSNTLGQLHLQSVEIKHFRGSKIEECLMKYLLACSPFLKRVAIYSHQSLGSDEKLSATTKLLKFHRASTVAQVDFY